MDRKAWTIISVVAVLIGGGLIYSIAGGSSDESDSTVGEVSPASETQNSATVDPPANDGAGSDGSGAGQPGQYVDYSPELVKSTPGTKLLFFHAPWCSQCQALEGDIEASTIPDDVTIFKVDYDTNQDLRQKYGVTIQTTMIKVDDDGEKLDELVAYDEPTFDSVKQALIQ